MLHQRITNERKIVSNWSKTEKSIVDIHRCNSYATLQRSQCSHGAFVFTKICYTCMNQKFVRCIQNLLLKSSDVWEDASHRSVILPRYTNPEIDGNLRVLSVHLVESGGFVEGPAYNFPKVTFCINLETSRQRCNRKHRGVTMTAKLRRPGRKIKRHRLSKYVLLDFDPCEAISYIDENSIQ